MRAIVGQIVKSKIAMTILIIAVLFITFSYDPTSMALIESDPHSDFFTLHDGGNKIWIAEYETEFEMEYDDSIATVKSWSLTTTIIDDLPDLDIHSADIALYLKSSSPSSGDEYVSAPRTIATGINWENGEYEQSGDDDLIKYRFTIQPETDTIFTLQIRYILYSFNFTEVGDRIAKPFFWPGASLIIRGELTEQPEIDPIQAEIRGSLNGKVLSLMSSSHPPVPGAKVEVLDSNGNPYLEDTTDANGEFSFTDIETMAVDYRISKTGWTTKDKSINLKEGTISNVIVYIAKSSDPTPDTTPATIPEDSESYENIGYEGSDDSSYGEQNTSLTNTDLVYIIISSFLILTGVFIKPLKGIRIFLIMGGMLILIYYFTFIHGIGGIG